MHLLRGKTSKSDKSEAKRRKSKEIETPKEEDSEMADNDSSSIGSEVRCSNCAGGWRKEEEER